MTIIDRDRSVGSLFWLACGLVAFGWIVGGGSTQSVSAAAFQANGSTQSDPSTQTSSRRQAPAHFQPDQNARPLTPSNGSDPGSVGQSDAATFGTRSQPRPKLIVESDADGTPRNSLRWRPSRINNSQIDDTQFEAATRSNPSGSLMTAENISAQTEQGMPNSNLARQVGFSTPQDLVPPRATLQIGEPGDSRAMTQSPSLQDIPPQPIDDPFGDHSSTHHQASTMGQQASTMGQIAAVPATTAANEVEWPNDPAQDAHLSWQRPGQRQEFPAETARNAPAPLQQVPSRFAAASQERRNIDDFRLSRETALDRFIGTPIDQINLNVTPWMGEIDVQQIIEQSELTGDGRLSPPDYEAELAFRAEQLANAKSRTWRDLNGDTIIDGRMVGIENRRVIIASADGELEVNLTDLSEEDLRYTFTIWQMPFEEFPVAQSIPARNHIPQTFTWKASALCHKTLFYEDVQLERYGHTAGPVLQPVLSTAHFFGSMAIVPYMSAIHPMTECNYALGYYRPGDCAPWLVDPIPLSLPGALRQTALVTGAVFSLP